MSNCAATTSISHEWRCREAGSPFDWVVRLYEMCMLPDVGIQPLINKNRLRFRSHLFGYNFLFFPHFTSLSPVDNIFCFIFNNFCICNSTPLFMYFFSSWHWSLSPSLWSYLLLLTVNYFLLSSSSPHCEPCYCQGSTWMGCSGWVLGVWYLFSWVVDKLLDWVSDLFEQYFICIHIIDYA